MSEDNEEEKFSYEVPKEELRGGVSYKKVYGRKPVVNKKFGTAPGELKIVPHLDWHLYTRP